MKTRRQPTPEQLTAREEKRARLRSMAAQIAAMSPTERNQILDRCGAVLTIEGHPLSVRNTMLCILQLGSPSVVGGFRQWIAAGRCVRKGQHGASILIPIGTGKRADAPADEDPLPTESETRFMVATVFDVSQTDPAEPFDITQCDNPSRSEYEATVSRYNAPNYADANGHCPC